MSAKEDLTSVHFDPTDDRLLRVVVTIGHTEILLPNLAGVEELLGILAQGIEIRSWYDGKVVLESHSPKLSLRFLDHDTKVVTHS